MEVLAKFTGWDYLVLLIALISFGLGLFRGMVRTVADLASWVVAFLAAPLLSPFILGIPGLNEYPSLALVLGFVVVFFLTRLVGIGLAKGLSTVGLASADRALGGLLGLARALLVIAALGTGAKMLGLDKQAAWQSAVSRELLESASAAVEAYIPKLPSLRRALPSRTS